MFSLVWVRIRWWMIVSSGFNREIVTSSLLCEVTILPITLAGRSEDESFKMTLRFKRKIPKIRYESIWWACWNLQYYQAACNAFLTKITPKRQIYRAFVNSWSFMKTLFLKLFCNSAYSFLLASPSFKK
jgi:hypothetical protein